MCLLQVKKLCFATVCVLLCCDLCRSVLFYPTNSAYGIFAAIAVPLDLPHRNVFISYNFEANYNLPNKWDIPKLVVGIEDETFFDQDVARQMAAANDIDCANCTSSSRKSDALVNATSTTTSTMDNTYVNGTSSQRRRRKRTSDSLLTRTHFYHIIKDKFERSGYNAEPCLLRLICETNASGLGDINGVLGTLVHIIFSPSTSINEYLPLAYYQAEMDGAHGVCEHYADECEESPLDLISAPLGDIIDSLTKNE